MANNNNIIRPPVLVNNQEAVNTAAITELVTRLVTETLRREGRQIINSILNPPADASHEVDQIIHANHAENLADMDKIPDVVKSLREFSGQAGEFSSWRKSVERILTIYEPLRGTPKYYGILSVIRNKIVGQADIVLESYNTPLNWNKISKCLSLHYADKRDLGTLEYQMTTLIQGNLSVSEFYQKVYHHLSLILNKLSSMEMSAESMNNLIKTYRDKALDTFVRGLRDDLPRLLSIKEPTDLPQALHLCLKLQNVNYRTQYANHSNALNRKYNMQAPPLPPKRNSQQGTQQKPMFHRNFNPELYHNPSGRPQNYHQNYQHQQRPFQGNSRPLPPKPLAKPEPMDIDPSIHSRAVDYQNRPKFQSTPQKRFPSQDSKQTHTPNKYQRIFNTEQQDTLENEDNTDQYTYQISQEEIDYDQTLTDYLDNIDHPQDQAEILDDINFLE